MRLRQAKKIWKIPFLYRNWECRHPNQINRAASRLMRSKHRSLVVMRRERDAFVLKMVLDVFGDNQKDV